MENHKSKAQNLISAKELPNVNFSDQLSKFVESAMNHSTWVLSCEDVELTTEEVSSTDGLLPLIMWIAGQTLEKLWGPQDLVFRCDSSALCGVVPELKRPVASASLWLYAIHYELEQATKSNDLKMDGQEVVIDSWFRRWNDALADKKILLLPPLQPTPNSSVSSGN